MASSNNRSNAEGGGEMKYPDHLVKQVKERSAPYQLEGF